MAMLNYHMKILETKEGTWTEPRAAFDFMARSREVVDEEIRTEGRRVLDALSNSDATNEFACQAKVVLAFTLMREEKWQEADAILAKMPRDATEEYRTRALYIRKQLRDIDNRLWDYLRRPMPKNLDQELPKLPA